MGEEFDICHHGSKFGREERQMLRIVVKGTDDPCTIFTDSTSVCVPAYLNHLELEGWGPSKFLDYRSRDHPNLTLSQKVFARRLQDVLLNQADSSSKFNMYLHDLVDHFIGECLLNDGLNLYTRVSKLSLKAGEQSFLVFSNMEGRNKRGIVWTLQECIDKFDTRYKKGDVQLAASLIGACQSNLLQQMGGGESKLKTLYGMKVSGEFFFFFRADFGTGYAKQLLTSSPPPDCDLVVHRYPARTGLRISNADDRKKLLSFMYRLREYSLEEGL